MRSLTKAVAVTAALGLALTGCGRTEEVSGDALEQWSQEVAAAHGFRDPEHFVEVYGLCSDC